MDVDFCKKTIDFFRKYNIIINNSTSFTLEAKGKYFNFTRIKFITFNFYINRETNLVDLDMIILDKNKQEIIYHEANIEEQKILIFTPGQILMNCL